MKLHSVLRKGKVTPSSHFFPPTEEKKKVFQPENDFIVDVSGIACFVPRGTKCPGDRAACVTAPILSRFPGLQSSTVVVCVVIVVMFLFLQSNRESGSGAPGPGPEALWDHVAHQPGSAQRLGPGADAEADPGAEAVRRV